jgi:2-isopropylmalate synthase
MPQSAKSCRVIFSDEVSPSEERVHALTTALGAALSDEQFGEVLEEINHLYDLKQKVYFEEIAAIVDEIEQSEDLAYRLGSIQITLGKSLVPTATVSLKGPDGKSLIAEATGNSSVEAIYSAIQHAMNMRVFVKDLSYSTLTQGIDSLGKASVEIEHHGRQVTARAYSTDILEAAAKAFLIGVNNIYTNRKSSFGI